MKKWMLTVGFAITCMTISNAQPSFELEFSTELQTNFGKNFNWANLLHLSAEIPSETINKRWTNGRFQIQTLSSYYLFEDHVIDDLLGYSNMMERMPLNIAMFGYEHQWGRFSLFGGVRSLPEDYFIKPHMSLFTNGPAGMAPTLAFNFPVADFPLSAMCLHVEFQLTENWLFETSLYNGVAHDSEKNPFKSFVVNPRNDGLFSISQLSFSQDKIVHGDYIFGVSVHTKGDSRWSFYGKIEQAVLENEKIEVGLILQGGFSPLSSNESFLDEPQCRSYLAIGAYIDGLLSEEKRDRFGIYFATADFIHTKERFLEITWQYDLSDRITIQPAFHIVRTGSKTRNVGLFRFIYSI